MNLQQTIDTILADALDTLGIIPAQPVRTAMCQRDGYDRQFNVLSLAKAAGIDPQHLAETLAGELRKYVLFVDTSIGRPDGVQVADKGFLNIRVSDQQIIVHAFKPSLLTDQPRKKIMLDFGSPNIAKALHVGHLRSLVIGESLRRILLARGHSVFSDIHYGDWGLPLGMVIGAIGKEPDSSLSFEQMYPIAVQECKDNPDRMAEAKRITVALQQGEYGSVWQKICRASKAEILPQIQRLGAYFDYHLGESSAQNSVESVLAMVPHRIDDGATIIDVASPDDKKPIPPLIFKKADGGYTYAATDLATIAIRSGVVGFDTILYVVDNRQSLHFQQVFRAAKHLEDLPRYRVKELRHIGFGTVNGPDGKPYKTRDGGVPTLASMLDAAVAKASERTPDPASAEIIGIGAIKFADLITQRESGYVFDLDRILAMEGKTGPYLQYAAVRIKSVMAMGEYPMGHLIEAPSLADLLPLSLQDHELLATCANLPEVIAKAEAQLSPAVIAEYAYTVAQKFSQFYLSYQIVGRIGGELTKESKCRLAICEITYQTLAQCLNLLGMDIPDKM